MNVNKESLGKSELKLTVELSVEEMAPLIEKAARRLGQHLNISGFRKGQAPLDVVKQKAGEMAVLQQAAELAVQDVLPKIIKDEGLDTVGQPAIGVDKLAPENPFVFTATLPLLPEVKPASPSDVKVEKDAVEVKEEEVTQVIDNLRKMRSKEVLVEREAKKDDKAEITFKVFLDNVPIDGGSSDKYPLVIGENHMIPGFEDNLVGMKKDEEKEFSLTFPEDYHNKQIAGKQCDFKVKMLAVYEVTLPELNEEFAKSAGDYDSVDALKDAIEKNIHDEKNGRADQDFERKVIEAMIEKTTYGDIPEIMVTNETRLMMNELEQNIARQGLKFDEYLQHLKKDRGQLMLDFAPDAVKRIKSALLIRTLAKQEDIQPSEEEVKQELDALNHAYQGNEQVLQNVNSPAYKEYIENVVRNRKTVHWLKDQVSS